MTEDDLVGRVRVGKSFTPIRQIAVRGLRGAHLWPAIWQRCETLRGVRAPGASDWRTGPCSAEFSARRNRRPRRHCGSLVAEQVLRLGISNFVLVDFDAVEESNLSRMWGARGEDAKKNRLKVDVIATPPQAPATEAGDHNGG